MSKELKITCEQIKVGYAIKLPCGWLQHPFLSNQFVVENSQQIEIIKGLKLGYVWFYPDKSQLTMQQTEPTAATKEATDEPSGSTPVSSTEQAAQQEHERLTQEKAKRIAQAKARRQSLQRTEKAYQQSLGQLKSCFRDIQSQPHAAFAQSEQLVNGMAQSLFDSESVMIQLIGNKKNESQDFSSHSLNVSVLSMLLGHAQGMSADELKILGLGALYHDLGKMKVPMQIQRKKEPLNRAEQGLLQLHPKFGLDLLNLIDDFPDLGKTIVHQHHERYQGGGYPLGLKGEEIHPMSQIVALVNQFDNLCHPLDELKALSPHHALGFMYSVNRDHHRKELLELFIKLMGIYPPGSIVQLSDERIGMILGSNSLEPESTQVLVFDPEVPSQEAPILNLEDGIGVQKALSKKQLTPEILHYLNPSNQQSYYFDDQSGK